MFVLFNSLFFLFSFFPIVTGVYYLLSQRYRWAWLLLVSCYFYMAFIPQYILILAFTISIDYIAGIWIEKLQGSNKRYFLILSILSNLGVLFVFKYFNFFNANVVALAQLLHWNYSLKSLSLVLPIGLSFHTFQSLSYIIEVYRGKQKAEKHYGIFALYVMFYPQLVAGPIERPQHLLHQFYERHRFDIERMLSALRLIIWGLFKKVVIADRLSFFVNLIFNNVHSYGGSYFLLATFFFAFQIYCDFSGYSDMARGLARALGFELMVNFNAPYFAKSVGEFWQRWHISLSSWFRDYVYIPLGGNRVSKPSWQFNLFIIFLLSGIWHGANWTFVVWGGLNGLYLIAGIWLDKLAGRFFLKFLASRFWAAIQTLGTFFLIAASWIFFRAASLGQAAYIFKQIITSGYRLADLWPFFGQYFNSLAIALAGILVLTVADYFAVYKNTETRPLRVPAWTQTVAFLALVIIILIVGRFTNEQFIYFQF